MDGGNSDHQALGLRGPHGSASFEDEQDYEFAADGRGFQGDPYSHYHEMNKAEYGAC
jgi:hypothetical protein